MASWQFPDNESSLIHAAKFQSDLGQAATDLLEAGAAAVTGQEEIALERGGAALEAAASGTGTMDLWFENGRVYTFANVPYSVFRELLTASSPGTFYNQNIRGNYPA